MTTQGAITGQGTAQGSALSQGRRQMVIRQLPYFMVVAEEEHFHRAAGRLNMAQSALSRRIQNLEEELGVELFIRGQRGVKLTQAGQMLQQEAQRILTDVDHAVGRIQALQRGEEGRLRLALTEGGARSPIATRSIRAFRDAYPDVRLQFQTMLTYDQIDALDNDALDIGILYDTHWDTEMDERIGSLELGAEPMLLALYDGHPLLTQDRIRIADLKDVPLIWASSTSGRYIHDQMVAAFAAAKIAPNIAMEVLTAEMTANLVASRLLIGFVPLHHSVPKGVTLRRVEGFDVAMQLRLAWPRHSTSPVVERFVTLVKAELEKAELGKDAE